jgi:uncharacterized Zn finger protein
MYNSYMDKDFNINLKEQPTVKCEQCQSVFFNEVTMIKKVSKLITGSPQDTIVPFPTYRCAECGHINDDFKIFE